jgi:hypothetical protein
MGGIRWWWWDVAGLLLCLRRCEPTHADAEKKKKKIIFQILFSFLNVCVYSHLHTSSLVFIIKMRYTISTKSTNHHRESQILFILHLSIITECDVSVFSPQIILIYLDRMLRAPSPIYIRYKSRAYI